MSCCNECEQSGGSCNQGLGMLGATLPAKSWIAAGFSLSAKTQNYSAQDIVDTVEGCLYQTGSFNTVIAYLKPEGFFSDAYLTVDAETYHDFAQPDDVSGFIFQTLGYCFPELIITEREPVIVGHIASGGSSGNPSNPGNRQPSGNPNQTVTPTGCPPGYYNASYLAWLGMLDCRKLPDTAPEIDECDWNTMDWDDYIACQLGIKTKEAVIVGALAALVGVIAISKIAK